MIQAIRDRLANDAAIRHMRSGISGRHFLRLTGGTWRIRPHLYGNTQGNLTAEGAALRPAAVLLAVVSAPYLLGSENGVLGRFTNYRLFLVRSKQICYWHCL